MAGEAQVLLCRCRARLRSGDLLEEEIDDRRRHPHHLRARHLSRFRRRIHLRIHLRIRLR